MCTYGYCEKCFIAIAGTQEREFWIKAKNLPHGGGFTESLGS